ncbi:hypothetical protein F0562_028238 [Nyssa sinensis]|uniref:Uncharacterized protein n=1 Tax=Nyssa sinensis TaxID=561372 RepID=A0A5J5B7B2_9ASTE|nr:hypothetical protein F0562_028238 [Nyssa sinensis]
MKIEVAVHCRQAVADFTENYSSATIVVAVSATIAVGQQRPIAAEVVWMVVVPNPNHLLRCCYASLKLDRIQLF